MWSVPDATAHRIIDVRRKIGTSRFRKEGWDGRCPVTSARSMCWNQVVHLLQVSAYSSAALELLRPGTIKTAAKTVKKKGDLWKLCSYFKRQLLFLNMHRMILFFLKHQGTLNLIQEQWYCISHFTVFLSPGFKISSSKKKVTD